MVNFFMVGSERFTWEIVLLGDKTCRLSIAHSAGTIVEYFTNTTAALQRQLELESLLTGTVLATQGSTR